jgi:prevent-host-death family protein
MGATVSVRDLRNHGGEVLARVQAGETLTVTLRGTPVAELHPVRNRYLTTHELIEQARRLPPMDPRKLREDIDAIIDQTV